jgi:hypothetical protein
MYGIVMETLPPHQAWWRMTLIGDPEYFNELICPNSPNSSTLIRPTLKSQPELETSLVKSLVKDILAIKLIVSKFHVWVFLMFKRAVPCGHHMELMAFVIERGCLLGLHNTHLGL